VGDVRTTLPGTLARRSDERAGSLLRRAVATPAIALAPLLLLFVALSFWFPEHPSDELNYLELARNIEHGQYTGLGWRPANPIPMPDPDEPDLWFGPGLPLTLTPLVALDLPLDVIRLTGPLFLFVAVLVFYGLLRLRMSHRLSLLGSYALGLYVPFYVLLSNLHSEPLAILALVTTMYLVARYLGSGVFWHGLAAGAAAAALALTRVAFGWVVTMVLVVFLIAWLVTRRRDFARVTTVFAMALALCVPWLAYTYSVTHRPFLWGNSGPLSLYWMSSPFPQDRGDWRGGANEIVNTDPLLAHHRAFFLELGRLDPVEQNRELERRALSNIAHHPGKFAENVAANVSRMWVDMPFNEKKLEPDSVFYAGPNVLLLVALVVSVIALVRRRMGIPFEGVVFATLGIFAFGLHAVLAAYPRMLMPLIPIVIWFTVYCIAMSIFKAGSSRHESRRPVALS
jgi:hypothetical protein